jgi:hypothetical protein
MDMLLTFILPAGLFLILELFWCRPSWSLSVSGAGLEREPLESGPPPVEPDWGLFSLPFVRHRLDVLAAELEQLERDESIFARAFRYRVAQSAYAALLVDAARLANASLLAVGLSLDAGSIQIEAWESRGELQEELEV